MAFLRPRWRLAGVAAVLVAAAGALAGWALVAGPLASRGPAGPPGTVTVTRALLGGHLTLWLTAQWTSGKRPGDPVELGGFSARFSTCRRGGFLDLRRSCTGLANPFFTVLGVTPTGRTVFRLTTRTDENNFAHGHRTGWIVPIDRRAGTLYRLAARDELIVQLWAINTHVDRPYQVGEIRG